MRGIWKKEFEYTKRLIKKSEGKSGGKADGAKALLS
jgi:hypothetical protein